MTEIARFQRLSSSSSARSVFHDADERPSAVLRAPGEPVELRIGREALCDAPEQLGRIDAVVVGERHDVRFDPVRARRFGHARGPAPRSAVPRRRSVRRRPPSTRSSSFWSTTITRSVGRTSEPRSSRGDGRARRCGPPSRRRGRTTEAPATRAVGYGTCRARRPARHRAPRRSRRRAPTCETALREPPRADGLGPRAHRRRRRVDRRHARDPRGASTTRASA